MKELITMQFLFDFFDGKTTSIQRKLIEEWLRDPANEETFYSCVDEWERRRPQFVPDRQTAQRVYELLMEGEAVSRTKKAGSTEYENVPPFFGKSWLWSAATVSLLLLTAFIFRERIVFETYTSASGQTSGFFLADSTMVTLNPNSTLKVPRFGFGNTIRQVRLQGEADFKVTRLQNDTKFRVLMGEGYQIEVLGTEFTAFSRASEKRIFLSEGKVKVELPQGNHLYMKPGSYFSANAEGDFKVTVPDEVPATKSRGEQTFYFDNTPLSEVARQIEERFKIKVKVLDKILAKTRIGGIYHVRDAHELLEGLSALLEIEITRKSDCIELHNTNHLTYEN